MGEEMGNRLPQTMRAKLQAMTASSLAVPSLAHYVQYVYPSQDPL